MKKLGVGIFGIGSAGHGVMHGYSTHPATEVRAICEVDKQRLEREAKEHNVSFATTNYDEMLARDGIDIVSVATPDHLHVEHVVRAFEVGKHVLVEKPMATTLADARRMIAAAENAGRKLMVSQTQRFVPMYRAIKRSYDEGTLGDLFFVEGSYVHDMWGHYSPQGKRYTPWRCDPKSPQNILLGGGCHPIDLILWTVNKPVSQVFCFANKKSIPEFPDRDCYIVTFRFADDCVGKVLVTSGCVGHGMGEGMLSLYGTKATVWKERLYLRGQEPQEIPLTEEEKKPLRGGHAWQAATHHFVDCIVNDRKPLIDGYEGAKTIALCEAALRSAESGQPVAPETV